MKGIKTIITCFAMLLGTFSILAHQSVTFLHSQNNRTVWCRACCGVGHNAYEPGRRSCSICNGEGRMRESAMNIRYNRWLKQEIQCSFCGGSGTSYRGRTEGFMNMDLLAPAGHYNCKVCKGKGKGTRGELMENFRIASEVNGPDL